MFGKWMRERNVVDSELSLEWWDFLKINPVQGIDDEDVNGIAEFPFDKDTVQWESV